MPAEKLTAADVAQRYQDGYVEVARHLHDYEVSKARFLFSVGHDCLRVIRGVLEPFPDHDLTGRKGARSKAVKEIEELLPELEGIGVAQVNRWIRWAGIYEVLGDELSGQPGLKQAHLMVLEKFVDQHEPTAAFRLKEPWKDKLDAVQECVHGTIETKASATQLEEAIDAEAEFPKPPETKEEPCQQSPTQCDSEPPTPCNASPTTQPTHPQTSATGSPASTPASTESKLSKKSPQPGTASSTSSPTPAVPSRTAVNSSPTSATATPAGSSNPSAKDLADQAFKLLQQPEILAGVFRREWEPDLVLAIVENLIRASGEKSRNPLALAKAYHRMKAVVLTHFEEYVADGKFKLRKKDQPEPPTLEQLAPELATA
jgi:hypothetical protein